MTRIAHHRKRFSTHSEWLRRARAHYKRLAWLEWNRQRSVSRKQLVYKRAIKRALECGLYAESATFESKEYTFMHCFYEWDMEIKRFGMTTATKISSRSGGASSLDLWHTWRAMSGFDYDDRFLVKVA